MTRPIGIPQGQWSNSEVIGSTALSKIYQYYNHNKTETKPCVYSMGYTALVSNEAEKEPAALFNIKTVLQGNNHLEERNWKIVFLPK